MDEAIKQGYVFIYVVFTVRNCSKENLREELENLKEGLKRMHRRKFFKKVVKGYMRTYEVTHNLKPNSDWYDTYHPHVNYIWAVKPSYFTSRDYISKDKLIDFWQQSMRLNYAPNIHIERAYTKNKGHIRELAKYCVKPGDYLTNNPEMTDSTVQVLDHALSKRRLVEWGGLFKKIRSQLKFDDPEQGDLINVDGQQDVNPELAYILESYIWNPGYRVYAGIND